MSATVETITFDPNLLTAIPEQKVYIKPIWDADWIDVSSELWASQVTWSMAPAFPFAQLECRYGRRMVADGSGGGWQVLLPQELLGQWVMIVVGTVETKESIQGQMRWIGRIEVMSEAQLGTRSEKLEPDDAAATEIQSGKQFFIAYGIEKWLDKHQITSSWYRVGGGLEARGTELRVQRAIAFNENGEGNCAPDFNAFCGVVSEGVLWTIEDMLWYLMTYAVPEFGSREFERSYTRDPIIKFEIHGLEEDWLTETPEVQVEGKTLYQVLNHLLPRFRLRGWYCKPSPERNGPCELHVVSLAGDLEARTDVGFGEDDLEGIIPSAVFKRVDVRPDLSAQVDLKVSTLDTYREVVVRGARRTSTATFSYGPPLRRTIGDWPWTKMLAPGWTEEQEERYTKGASEQPEYGSLSRGAKEEANKEARQVSFLRPVFTRYLMEPEFVTWTGIGQTLPLLPSASFLSDLKTTSYGEDPAPVDRRFTRYTSLYAEIDYRQTEGEVQRAFRPGLSPLPPLVFFPTPATRQAGLFQDMRWSLVDSQGLAADLPESGMNQQRYWSASVTVDPQGALRVVPLGEMPDILAGPDYWERLENDWEPLADWREMLVTATVAGSEYAQAVEQITETSAADELIGDSGGEIKTEYRTLVLYVGDRYRFDFLVEGTVLGVDASGRLIRAEEGMILRDDRSELREMAKTALLWYSQPRAVLHLRTQLVSDFLQLGDYVVGLAKGTDETAPVNSVVTEITYQANQVEIWKRGGRAPAPILEITTGYGELDPMKMGAE